MPGVGPDRLPSVALKYKVCVPVVIAPLAPYNKTSPPVRFGTLKSVIFVPP